MSWNVKVFAIIVGLFVSDKDTLVEPVDFKKLPTFEVCGFKFEPIKCFTSGSDEYRDLPNVFDKDSRGYIATKVIHEIEDQYPPKQSSKELDTLMSCFKLFKQGYVGVNPIIAQYHSATPPEVHFTAVFGSTPRDRSGGIAYGLPGGEIKQLKDFSEAIYPLLLSRLDNSRDILPLVFYNRGIDDIVRSEYQMAIVDFSSCLEGLFSDSNQEIGHKLAERIAVVYTNHSAERVKVFERIKSIYGKRSKILHGVGVKDQAWKLADDSTYVWEVARYSMKLSLTYELNGKNKDAMLSDIQDVLFGSLQKMPDLAHRLE